MKQNDSYEVQFSGLNLGKHEFQWDVNQSLLAGFDLADLHTVALRCEVELDKKERIMTFQFKIEGSVRTNCDRCGEEVELPLHTTDHLVVRFAEENDFTDDEVIFLADNEHTLDLGQFIYEYVMTGLPNRKVHAKGKCNPQVESYLSEKTEDQKEQEIDPRWEALKKLK